MLLAHLYIKMDYYDILQDGGYYYRRELLSNLKRRHPSNQIIQDFVRKERKRIDKIFNKFH